MSTILGLLMLAGSIVSPNTIFNNNMMDNYDQNSMMNNYSSNTMMGDYDQDDMMDNDGFMKNAIEECQEWFDSMMSSSNRLFSSSEDGGYGCH